VTSVTGASRFLIGLVTCFAGLVLAAALLWLTDAGDTF